MINLIKRLFQPEEISLAKKVIEKVECRSSLKDTAKAFLSYEEKINAKNYRPQIGLRIYVESQYGNYLAENKNSMNNDSCEEYNQVFEKYKF